MQSDQSLLNDYYDDLVTEYKRLYTEHNTLKEEHEKTMKQNHRLKVLFICAVNSSRDLLVRPEDIKDAINGKVVLQAEPFALGATYYRAMELPDAPLDIAEKDTIH